MHISKPMISIGIQPHQSVATACFDKVVAVSRGMRNNDLIMMIIVLACDHSGLEAAILVFKNPL